MVTNGSSRSFPHKRNDDNQMMIVVEELRLKVWSGRWESNPHLNLGKVAYYHCTTPAFAVTSRLKD